MGDPLVVIAETIYEWQFKMETQIICKAYTKTVAFMIPNGERNCVEAVNEENLMKLFYLTEETDRRVRTCART